MVFTISSAASEIPPPSKREVATLILVSALVCWVFFVVLEHFGAQVMSLELTINVRNKYNATTIVVSANQGDFMPTTGRIAIDGPRMNVTLSVLVSRLLETYVPIEVEYYDDDTYLGVAKFECLFLPITQKIVVYGVP